MIVGKIKNEYFYTEDMYKDYCDYYSNIDNTGGKHQWLITKSALMKWAKKNKLSEFVMLKMDMRRKEEWEQKIDVGVEMGDIKDFNAEIYKFAKRIYNMEDGSTLDWGINDGYADIAMGLKKMWMFDCSLLISSAYGGGHEGILWIKNGIKPIDIYRWLMDTYVKPIE